MHHYLTLFVAYNRDFILVGKKQIIYNMKSL